MKIELPRTVADNLPIFTGREWVLPALLKWWDQEATRFFVLTGEPGTGKSMLSAWLADDSRTLYRFDVRTPEEFAAGHLAGFRSAPGGQLVQETDVFAPVRGARILLVDGDGVRANMTASWLAQMAWEVYVLDNGLNGESLVIEAGHAERASAAAAPRTKAYKRPYEGTDNPHSAMQAYLDWEYGLVAQLERDGTHGFRVV